MELVNTRCNWSQSGFGGRNVGRVGNWMVVGQNRIPDGSPHNMASLSQIFHLSQ